MFPDVLVAVALFLALIVSSMAFAQVLADFVAFKVVESDRLLYFWIQTRLACCLNGEAVFSQCSC